MIWIPVILLLLTALAGLGLLYTFCHRQAVPDPWSGEALQGYGDTPYGRLIRGEMAWFEGVDRSPVSVSADDDLLLRGVLLPRPGARGTVVLLHGYRSGWKEDFVNPGLARFFYEQGWQVLMPDQRAHGASGGRFLTLGIWERYDARAWCNYLAFRYGDSHPIFLYGHSMGGTAALLAASLDLPGSVRGIMADGAYTSPAALLHHTLLKSSLPEGPTMGLLNAAAGLAVGFRLDEASTLRTLAEANYPVLLIHGTQDEAVPVRMARQNFEACRSRKELVLVEGAGHGQCWLAEPERVRRAVGMFMK